MSGNRTLETGVKQLSSSVSQILEALQISMSNKEEEKQQIVPAFYAAVPKTVKYAKSLDDFFNKRYQAVPKVLIIYSVGHYSKNFKLN